MRQVERITDTEKRCFYRRWGCDRRIDAVR